MLAEQWRAAHPHRRVRQFDRAADSLIRAAGRIVDIDDHVARLQMWIGQDLAGVLTGAAGHAGGAENAHDLVLGTGAGPLLDDRVQGGAVLPAYLLGRKAWILGQFRPIDRLAEGRPHLLLRSDEGVVVGATRCARVSRRGYAAAHLVAATRHRRAETLMVA